jgi:hypothetical protein
LYESEILTYIFKLAAWQLRNNFVEYNRLCYIYIGITASFKDIIMNTFSCCALLFLGIVMHSTTQAMEQESLFNRLYRGRQRSFAEHFFKEHQGIAQVKSDVIGQDEHMINGDTYKKLKEWYQNGTSETTYSKSFCSKGIFINNIVSVEYKIGQQWYPPTIDLSYEIPLRTKVGAGVVALAVSIYCLSKIPLFSPS